MNATLVYAICFGAGLIFTLVGGLFAGVFGGDGHLGGHGGAEGHAEGGFASHDMPGFSPISPTTLATFLTSFGGIGLVLDKLQATASPWISAPLAALGAFVIAAAVFFMFSAFFRKTQSSSEARVANLVGQPASIITPVPAVGLGEIAYIQGGSRYTAPARALDGKAIPTGTAVIITRIVGAEFYVKAS